MPRLIVFIFVAFLCLTPISVKGMEREEFQVVAPNDGNQDEFRLKTNLLLWAATIPNIGVEGAFGEKWSTTLDIWYSPWKISEKLAVKTIAILPEIRFWVKSNRKGSFFNLHANVAWFNVRANNYRYQDTGRPLLGGGVGYGYRLRLNDRWGLEFEIGAGVANAKYDRYYNIPNGAKIDQRSTTYWGIDRASVTITCNL